MVKGRMKRVREMYEVVKAALKSRREIRVDRTEKWIKVGECIITIAISIGMDEGMKVVAWELGVKKLNL